MSVTSTKIEALIATLDPDEREQLAKIGPDTTRDEVPAGLLARLDATVAELTADDRAEILAVVATTGSGDDVEGFGWVSPDVNQQWGSSNVTDHRAGSAPTVNDNRGGPGAGTYGVLLYRAVVALYPF